MLEFSAEEAGLGLSVQLDVFPGQPVLRHQVTIVNQLGRTVQVKKK